jgi:hypothetical protein
MSTASASSPSGIGVNLVFICMIILALVAAVALIGNAAAVASAAEAAVPVAEIVYGDPEIEGLGQVPAEYTASEAAALSVVGGVIVDPTYSHAMREHPEDMPTVRKCLGDSKTWKGLFTTGDPNRYLRACVIGGMVIFQIIERIREQYYERTAYTKEGLCGKQGVEMYTAEMRYSYLSRLP